MKTLRLITLACTLLAVLLASVSAQQPAAPTLWLVMIDIDQYDDATIKTKRANKALLDGVETYFRAIPVQAPPHGARKLWRLSSQDPTGKTHPKAETIRAVLNNPEWGLVANAQARDTVLIFFAGEGTIVAGQKYILPMDADSLSAEIGAIPVAEFDRMLEALRQKNVDAQMFLVCDFTASAGASAPLTPEPVSTAAAAMLANPTEAIEGVVVFDNPPFGKGTVHRVVLQDANSRQMYLSWDRSVTDQMPEEQRPRLGARLVVKATGGKLDEEGAISITDSRAITNLGQSPTPVWPPHAELGSIDTKLAHHAVWTEGEVTKITPGKDPLPTFMTLAKDGKTLDVVFWENTAQPMVASGKLPNVGQTIRIGGLVQLYKGSVQFRFNHPEHLAVVR